MNSRGSTKRRRVFQVKGLGYPYTQSYCWRELEEGRDYYGDWAGLPENGRVFFFTLDWPPRAEFAVKICG